MTWYPKCPKLPQSFNYNCWTSKMGDLYQEPKLKECWSWCTINSWFFCVSHIICCRTRLMFEKAGLEDYSEVHVQILGSEETYGAQAKANLNGVSRTAHIF